MYKLLKDTHPARISGLQALCNSLQHLLCTFTSIHVAGTTERIFEEKSGICDIYVDNHSVKVPPNLQHLLTITPEDRKHFTYLQSIVQSSSSRLEAFHNFFTELNNKIFATLSDVAVSARTTLGKEEIHSMGLSPQQDRSFVRELAATHGFDVTVKGGACQHCCPMCCSCVSWPSLWLCDPNNQQLWPSLPSFNVVVMNAQDLNLFWMLVSCECERMSFFLHVWVDLYF